MVPLTEYSVLAAVASLFLLDQLRTTFAVRNVINETKSGKIRGIRENVLGVDLDIYLGIPYAIPPLNERRFKHPESIPPWDGIKDATQFPNACYQEIDHMYDKFEGVDMWNPNTPMSEDCLYLNIWAPADRPFGKSRGVLVWIYGGSFTSGSSSLDVYDGRILAAQGDVIVVSMNYRLGIFGFLYDGTDNIPGNMGLYDQTRAIQWVYNNIDALGGDNRRITVFGESAGSVSTSLLLLSPLSRGFINNVILLSGTAAHKWSTDTKERAQQKYDNLLQITQCKSDNESYNCLIDMDAEALASFSWLIDDHSKVPTPLGPVVDGEFLTDSPHDLLRRGHFKSNTPILLGSVADEATYFFVYAQEYLKHFKLNNNHITGNEYTELLQATLNNNNRALVDLVNYEYELPGFGNRHSPASSTQDYINLLDDIFTDRTFICYMLEYSNYQSAMNNPVYMYYFNHRTSVNPWPEWMGVMHGYEIDHVFGAPLNESLPYLAEEKTLSEAIIKYWTNFVKSGFVCCA